MPSVCLKPLPSALPVSTLSSSSSSSSPPPPPLPQRRPKFGAKTPSSDSLPSRPTSSSGSGYMEADNFARGSRSNGSSLDIETETEDDGGGGGGGHTPPPSIEDAADSALTWAKKPPVIMDADDWQRNERAYEDLCYVTFSSSQVR